MYSGYKFSITYVLCKYFPSVHGLVFHSLNHVFHRMKVLHFDKFQFTNFYTMNYALIVILNNSLLDPRPQRSSPLLSLRRFIILPFMFSLMIYLDLTVV